MRDTRIIALGASIGAITILMPQELTLLAGAGIFAIETLSVIM